MKPFHAVLGLMFLSLALPAFAVEPDKSDALYRSLGDHTRSYKFPATGEVIPYRVFVPSTWSPNKKLPLIVALHGGGLDENAPFDRGPPESKGILAKLAEEHGYIVVSPLGYTSGGGFGGTIGFPMPISALMPAPPAVPADSAAPKPRDPNDAPAAMPKMPSPEEAARSEQDVFNVIDIVTKEYNADPARTVMIGNSMGMIGTMYLATKYPDKWLAIAPSEGPMQASRYNDQLAKLKVKGVRIIKKEDTPERTADAQEMVRQIGALGIDAELVVVPNSRHETAWYMVLPATFDFLDKYTKQKRGS